jgi:riboflavin biosynthesis pyrimidine reductase
VKSKKRPYVICHMGPSLDGKIVTTGWPRIRDLTSEYERIGERFNADAWIVGRISMQPYAGKARVPRAKSRRRIPGVDFIGDVGAKSYVIAIDPSGKLTWTSSRIDGESVITILSKGVSDRYLAFLQSKGISYLFGGKTRIDLTSVLERLRSNFGIRKLLLEGGGAINGSFLAAGLIDELSVLIAPVADGSVGTPTLFDAKPRSGPRRPLRLVSVQRLKRDFVWLRYQVGS